MDYTPGRTSSPLHEEYCSLPAPGPGSSRTPEHLHDEIPARVQRLHLNTAPSTTGSNPRQNHGNTWRIQKSKMFWTCGTYSELKMLKCTPHTRTAGTRPTWLLMAIGIQDNIHTYLQPITAPRNHQHDQGNSGPQPAMLRRGGNWKRVSSQCQLCRSSWKVLCYDTGQDWEPWIRDNIHMYSGV